jgi:hypothetical protein
MVLPAKIKLSGMEPVEKVLPDFYGQSGIV